MAGNKEKDVKVIDVRETTPVSYPSGEAPRMLNVVASALSAAAIVAQAAVAISQQMGKSKREKAGLEGAIRMTLAVTLARAIPSVLSEIRTINRELQRGKSRV